eukprot:13569946-Ditylum_brightwellii.AAC.1
MAQVRLLPAAVLSNKPKLFGRRLKHGLTASAQAIFQGMMHGTTTRVPSKRPWNTLSLPQLSPKNN